MVSVPAFAYKRGYNQGDLSMGKYKIQGDKDTGLAFDPDADGTVEFQMGSDGNVGIGTSDTSAAELTVNGKIKVLGAGSSDFAEGMEINSTQIDSDTIINGLSAEVMRIDASSLRVGIGTSAPKVLLDLDSSSTVEAQLRTVGNEDATFSLVEASPGKNFGEVGANGFRIKMDGTANALKIQSGAETTVSDRFSLLRDSGYVGLGIAVPTKKLHIYGSDAVGLLVERTSTVNADVELKTTEGSIYIGCSSDDFIVSSAADLLSSDRLIVKNEGNVGIGVEAPSYLLEVNGTMQADDFYSGDGTQGVTVTTCTSFKDGLCVAGT